MLSLCEQQRLAFARLLVNCPGYAVLDEATGALDVVNEPTSIDMAGIRYISVGHRRNTLAFHDRVLELQATDQWRLLPVAAHREALDNGKMGKI